MMKVWMTAAVLAVGMGASGASCFLSYEEVPEHVTLTLTANGLPDAEARIVVTGPAEGATIYRYPEAPDGWTVAATPDPGYKTPTFSARLYFTNSANNERTWWESGGIMQVTGGSVTLTGDSFGYGNGFPYELNVFEMAVEPETYTVTFHANANGAMVDPAARDVTFDHPYGDLPVPIRRGYTFAGWYTEEDGGMPVTAETVVSTPDDHSLYATWRPNVYSVVFDGNGGDGEMEPMQVEYDQEIVMPACTFTRAAYTFAGWCKTSSEGSADYRAGDSVKNLTAESGGTVTLYAVWTAQPTYAVTFTVPGGTIDRASLEGLDHDGPVATNDSEVVTVRYTLGAPYGTLPVAAFDGRTFAGWRYPRDGVWVCVNATDAVPDESAGITNLTARFVRDTSLAEALEIGSWDVSSTRTDVSGTNVAWQVVKDETAVGGTAVSLKMPDGSFTDERIACKLKTKVQGKGTLSFRWKIVSAEPLEALTSYPDWRYLPERIYFEINDSYNYLTMPGLSATASNVWTSSGADWASWTPDWREAEIKIGTDGIATAVAWGAIFENWYIGAVSNWTGGTAWVDNVRWTGDPPEMVIENPYAVTFDANDPDPSGASGVAGTMAVQTNDLDRAAVLPDNAYAKDGYRFAGWNTQADGSGVRYANGASLEAYTNVTLYAQWAVFDGAPAVPPEGLTIGWNAAGALIVSADIPNAVAQWRYVLTGADAVVGPYEPVSPSAVGDACSVYAEEDSSAEEPLQLRLTVQPAAGPRFFKIRVTE